MRTPCTLLALAVVAGCAGPGGDADGEPADLVIADVDVLPMTGDTLWSIRTLVIRSGRIDAVLEADQAAPPAAVEVDGAGMVAMPGLVDMHVHLRSVNALPLYLASGVTTVRNMNGAFGDALRWRAEVSGGQRPGPTLLTSTPTIRDDKGEDYRYRIRTAEDVHALVAEADSLGYDLVKVYQVPPACLDSLVSQAGRRGLQVSGHVPFFAREGSSDRAFRDTLGLVLASGMASIEHLGGLVFAGLRGDTATDGDLRALAEAVARSGAAVTSTLGQDADLAAIVLRGREAHDSAQRALIQRYTGEAGLSLLEEQEEGLYGSEPWTVGREFRLVDALHDAGVPILLGTDSHGPNALAGISAIEEVGNLVRAGLTGFEALEAATAAPARFLGREGELGVVAVGAMADLILVPSDPREDWRRLFDLSGVVLQGRWMLRSELDSLAAVAVAAGTYCRADRCED